ncbi:Adhesion G-protein coupled receptor G2 [Collichthys lucidus]|uniref:Adhesion G-protein coupled receptor G2 n=1 Tax=Collichthys lucidus TaxID=240159 RepID=A0A4U5UPS7_COLLU|nr:Adhesion G-protein coupled receptor G2 [Collichthys lucidus]
MKWITWLLFVAILGIGIEMSKETLRNECFAKRQTSFVVIDIFTAVIKRNCSQETCNVTRLDTKNICKSSYSATLCSNTGQDSKDKYIINLNESNCMNCDNPVKKPEATLTSEDLGLVMIEEKEEVSSSQAAEVMGKMSDLVFNLNESSAAVSLGNGVQGIIVKETEPEDVDEISFAYSSPVSELSIIEGRKELKKYSRSVTVSKEAFEEALKMNISVPFAAVFRFINMSKDEKNSTVLGNEILAIEMGTTISNLTDKIGINFFNMDYTPLNKTISSTDLSNLTIITQVGCGLSMFFLAIVLFMHCLLTKNKASLSTKMLINLVVAMFLLNFTFLINNFVASLKNSVGCKIMAAAMHYFMLATFTWFSVQAFHLCLQLYMMGKVVINRYLLKVCIISWVLPGIFVIALLSSGKYGEQFINNDDSNGNVAMCWITDNDTHYIVNIGYYVVVFIFTFTTFIITMSWLFCIQKTNTGKTQNDTSGPSIVTIMGLCCLLGITWGFAFFAYGPLRIPSYYIFTTLNSFQGFFLFIYYYKSSQNIKGDDRSTINSSSSTATLKTSLDILENPYKKK